MENRKTIIRAVLAVCLAITLICNCTFATTASTESDIVTTEETIDINDSTTLAGVSLAISDILTRESKYTCIEEYETPIVGSSYDEDVVEEDIIEETTIVEEEPLYSEVESYTMYVGCSVINVRSTPEKLDDNKLGKLKPGDIITVIGLREDKWVAIEYDDDIAFVNGDYIQETSPEEATYNWSWTGSVLNKSNGRNLGPLGYETYYNLPMGGCVKLMNSLGYYGDVWTRSDGVKMWDQYVMVAADLNTYPKGTIVETSLGMGIVVDTGSFTTNGSGVTFDIAVSW